MAAPFFIVISLSRCGSTALQRALSAHRQITCLFEPDFVAAGWDAGAVAARLVDLRDSASGIKHVWDPSGFPFISAHRSEVREMSARRAQVLAMNRTVLSAVPARVVFLRRRNQLARVLSDAIGQQTDLWGPEWPDGRMPAAFDEARKYRAQVGARQLQPVNLEVVQWYLDHVGAMETELRSGVADGLDLDYEDLFAARMSLADRRRKYLDLVEFLGYSTDPGQWNREVVDAVLAPDGKLNDATTLARIPNIREVARRFPGVSQDLVPLDDRT